MIYVLIESLALFHLVDYRLVFGTASLEPKANPLNRLDKELIYVHRPYLHLRGVMPAGDIGIWLPNAEKEPHPYDVRADRDGFRNPTDLERADIVVIGDSYIEGMIIPQEDLVSSDLSRLLGKTVLNLGQAGYGPQQEFIAFKRYGLPRKPKLCIWFFFEGNDLVDINDYINSVNHWEFWTVDRHSFWERSFQQNLKYYFWPRPKPKVKIEDHYGILPNGKKTYFFSQSNMLSGRNLKSLQILEKELVQFGALLKENDVAFLMAFVPNKSRIYRDVCQFPQADCDQWFVEDLPLQLAELLERAVPGATFLDLSEPLHQAARDGRRVYFEDDTHWTAVGHEIAAEEIARVIRDKNLLGNLSPNPPAAPLTTK